jgi:hypothetical protein
MGTSGSVKDILAIMCDQEVLATTTGHPVIHNSVSKTGADNFARNSSDLEALNLLHDDLIIPCHRRKHQLSGFVATFESMIIQLCWLQLNHRIK